MYKRKNDLRPVEHFLSNKRKKVENPICSITNEFKLDRDRQNHMPKYSIDWEKKSYQIKLQFRLSSISFRPNVKAPIKYRSLPIQNSYASLSKNFHSLHSIPSISHRSPSYIRFKKSIF